MLILGCGYTGSRVARRMASRGYKVWASSRHNLEFKDTCAINLLRVDTSEPDSLEALKRVPSDSLVLHSIPLVEQGGAPADPTPQLLEALGSGPQRMVYLSTTSVYGAMEEVNERSPVQPRTPREVLRVEAERLVQRGPWRSMVLRPAAIYGPGRGMQASMPKGEFRLMGDGSNWVSRIHVDDLAELASAALTADAEGAWPVADSEPARSRDVAAFVAELTGCPMPESSPISDLHPTRRANRRVDGRAVFKLLKIRLKFPTYREGISHSLGRWDLKC